MKKFLVAALLLCSGYTYSQYYYVDVVGTKQTNQQYKLIAGHQLKRINATSFDANNEPSKDFVLEQRVNNNAQEIVTRSATIGTVESYFTSQYNNGRVVKTRDSSSHAINTIEYQYDNAGRVLATHATGKDFDGTFTSTESHLWSYNDKGHPVSMLKIKNDKDTTSVTFKYDDDDNVAEEIWRKKNRVIETYYYYYNPKKQLTDIVRYSRKARQLIPDFTFEYDSNGRVSQMMQTQSASANYLIYKYTYNDRGLKDKEIVFNKQKELLGRVEYAYQ
jgi:YD repeat-containing protein